ncbi:MAG TPA: hypothetical protein VN033_12165, partial [Vulgatibacter sp.]|nr:hypothetical protein [Vulgatibacter sp.]
RALVLRRLAPLGLVLAALLFGERALGEWLPRMVPVHSERLGLEVELPARWHRRAEMVFDNGMMQPGLASFAAGIRRADAPPDLERAAAEYFERELRPQLAAGRIRDLVERPSRRTEIAGVQGVAREASFVVADDETEVALTAYLFAKEDRLYDLVVIRPRRLAGYDRIFDRIVRSVQVRESGPR